MATSDLLDPARIISIAREWNILHPDRPLQIGDISRPDGINTTEHATHGGNEFDVRAQSKSKIVGSLDITGNQDYSQFLTKEFILLVLRLYPGIKVLFNDVDWRQMGWSRLDFKSPGKDYYLQHFT